MNEPLVCEDTDLDRLLETIRAEHGDAADILYQDSVRRGGVMGFFAQEVHRVVYRVCETGREAGGTSESTSPAKALDFSHDAVDMHPFEAMLAQQAKPVDRPAKPAAKRSVPAARPEPAEIEMPWLADLLEDEPIIEPPARKAPVRTTPARTAPAAQAAPVQAAPVQAAPAQAAPARRKAAAPAAPPPIEHLIDDDEEFMADGSSRIVSYAFPRAEPTARAFNNKPQATDELVIAAEESEKAMSATLEVPPLRMTAQERFAELLQAMEEAKAAEAEAEAHAEALSAPVQSVEAALVEAAPVEAAPLVEAEVERPRAVTVIKAAPVVEPAPVAPAVVEPAPVVEPIAIVEPIAVAEPIAIAEPAVAQTQPVVVEAVVVEAETITEPEPAALPDSIGAYTEPSTLDLALRAMLTEQPAATPPAAPIEALDCPTIEDEPAEQSYEPFEFVQESVQRSRSARHSAGEPDAAEDITSSPAPIISEPVRENAQVVSLPATGDARARMDMTMRLREVGVPASVNPSGEAANIYEALDEILSELPATPVPPRKPGDVLVIIGDIGPALRAAQSVARTLRLRDSDIWVADLESHPVVEIGGAAAANTHAIANPRHAARVRAELVQADVASVIVVATDGAEAAPNDPWIGEMLEALRPTAVWACVDATRKSSDTAARLALLGDIDALAVHSAAISSSPASVWEIGIPVALLDGRTAGVPTWAGLLLSLLSVEEPAAEIAEESDSRHSRSARHRSA